MRFNSLCYNTASRELISNDWIDLSVFFLRNSACLCGGLAHILGLKCDSMHEKTKRRNFDVFGRLSGQSHEKG